MKQIKEEYLEDILYIDDMEENLLDFIDSLSYSNRELSLAKTNLEQSFMWLRRGIFMENEDE